MNRWNSKNFKRKKMERFLAAWLVLSTVVCAWDAGFVLLRPRSMADGDLEAIWRPYKIYIEVDQRYSNLEDDFVVAQSWANLLEGVLNIMAVILLCSNRFTGIILSYVVTIMTFWKTVIYFLCSSPLVPSHGTFAHLSMNEYVFLFLIPNGVWIIVPLVLIIYLSIKICGNMKKYKTL